MKIHKIIASGLGAGYMPWAPGTAGSIVGVFLMYGFNHMLISYALVDWQILLLNFVAVVLVVIIGVYSIKKVHAVWKHDDSKIVIDEIAGVWITLISIPLNWKYYLAALVLFRIFDITKPLFIKKIDKKEGNWSVMMDDVVAGVYSLIVLKFLLIINLL